MSQYTPSTLTGLLDSETCCSDAKACNRVQLEDQERRLKPALPSKALDSLKYSRVACSVAQPDRTLSTYKLLRRSLDIGESYLVRWNVSAAFNIKGELVAPNKTTLNR